MPKGLRVLMRVLVVGAGIGLGAHIAQVLTKMDAQVVVCEEEPPSEPIDMLRAPNVAIPRAYTGKPNKRKHRGKRKRGW